MLLRDKLLDAAVKVYGAHGYRGATTRLIADAAGVNEVTLFRTFGSKAALIDEAVRARSGASGVASLPLDPADAQAELTAWATALHAHLRRMRSLIRKCMSEMEERPKMSGAVCEGPSWAARELREYGERLKQGALAAPDADTVAGATMLLSALMHDAMGRELIPAMFPMPAANAPAQYVRVYLRAMGAPTSGGTLGTNGRAPRRALAALRPALALALALAPFMSLRAQQPAAPRPAAGRSMTLQQAYQQAESHNPSVRVARAQLDRARGQEWQARSQYLPQLNAQFLYTKTLATQFSALSGGPPDTRPLCRAFAPVVGAITADRIDSLERAVGLATNCRAAGGIDFSKAGFGAANQWQLGLSASLNLFTGGRVTAVNRVASAGYRTADLELRSQRAQLALNVAQAYFDAVLADRLLAIAESSLVQTEAVYRQVQVANTVGNAAEFELLRASVTRDNQRPQLIQRRSDRDVARLRLKQVLDLAPADSFVLTTSPNDEDPAIVQTLLLSLGVATNDTSTAARALVKQAGELVRVQEDQFRVSRSQRLPTVTLTSSYGRVAFSQQDFQFPNLDSFLTNWTVSLTASLPLFTGGRVTGDEMVSRANLAEAQARLDQARQGASIDARQTASQLEQASSAWQASAGTSEQAAKAYRIAEVRYREGISTQVELNESRLLLQQTQANRAAAARNLQLARLRVALLRDLPLGAASAVAGGQSTAPPSSTQGQQGAGSSATASQQGAAGGANP